MESHKQPLLDHHTYHILSPISSDVSHHDPASLGSPVALDSSSPSEMFRLDDEVLQAHPKYHEKFVKGRNTTISSAVFNLVSTIIGGGVLSLPYAIHRSGVVLGLTMLVLAGVTCDWSVYILISCSRRTGAQSFRQVAEKTFGHWAGVMILACLIVLTYLCCVAYCILMRDIVPPLLETSHILSENPSHGTVQLVMVVCTGLVTPLSFLPSLHALRFTSFICVLSVFVLALCLTYHSIVSRHGNDPGVTPDSHSISHAIRWWPDSLFDVLYVFPIFSVAFLCHFNVLPIHCDLIIPSRQRIKRVVHTTVGVCGVLYFWIALAGYFTTYAETKGNIFNNFKSNDPAMTAGRIALACTIITSFPLLVLPCRQSLAEFLSIFLPRKTVDFTNRHRTKFGVLWALIVVAASLLLAMEIKSVVTIWNYMGSTVGVLISMILPPAFYLKARRPSLQSSMTVPAWLLLVFGLVSSFLCLWEAVRESA
eukprot:c26144_g1_i1.p1 GENE.c26144_g1_i1~~c26144_g1_i1.p1  ORF type:complete len:480 (-),score=101.72 c26144_g1_i1:81-1520(-)